MASPPVSGTRMSATIAAHPISQVRTIDGAVFGEPREGMPVVQNALREVSERCRIGKAIEDAIQGRGTAGGGEVSKQGLEYLGE